MFHDCGAFYMLIADIPPGHSRVNGLGHVPKQPSQLTSIEKAGLRLDGNLSMSPLETAISSEYQEAAGRHVSIRLPAGARVSTKRDSSA